MSESFESNWEAEDFMSYSELRIACASRIRRWGHPGFDTGYEAMAAYLGRPIQPLHKDDVGKLLMLLGPHGYAIYKAALARRA